MLNAAIYAQTLPITLEIRPILVWLMSLNLPPDDNGLDVDLLANPGQAKVKAKPRVKKTKTGQSGPPTEVPILPPDDDEGASFATSEGIPGVPKTKPARGRGQGGGCAAASKSKSKPGVIKNVKGSNPKSLGQSEGTDSESGLLWSDQRLKDAAKQFKSIVEMPYTDLASLYFGEPPMMNHDRCDLWEIYSVPRLGPCIRELGGQCRRSYDILHFWNLANSDYKRLLIQDICLLRPKALMLSPPCRFLCLLMASNWSRMKHVSEKMMNLEEALGHIDLTMWLAQFQILHDAIFAFEHPQGSLAWDRDSAPWFILFNNCCLYFMFTSTSRHLYSHLV